MAGLVVWWLRWPVTFEAQVRLRVRSWWRAGFVYRRRWATAMDTAGLLVERHRTDYVPPLLKVRSTRTVDRVPVRMLPGQRVEDYAGVADRLAQTFGAVDCRVRSVRSGGIWSSSGSWSTIRSKRSCGRSIRGGCSDRRDPGRAG